MRASLSTDRTAGSTVSGEVEIGGTGTIKYRGLHIVKLGVNA
jgi:hypothetical protein